jgi:dTDP-4-dehydrorhamnose reductase
MENMNQSRRKIFIAGGSGQVGFELMRAVSPLGEVFAPTRHELDLFNLDAVAEYLEELKPDLIFNAAAWTAVDVAETEQANAFALNAKLPELLAQYSKAANIPLIHYSSDYVYPGDGTGQWREDDQTGPLSVYGHSKLEGDKAVASQGGNYLIFRTSWVYSARGNNFMKTMLRLAKEREELGVVCDQMGAPTPARLIAQVSVLAAYKNMLTATPTTGTYHLAPTGEVSWHGFAERIFEAARALGEALSVRQVNAIPTSSYPTPAQRPLNSRLNLEKIQSAFELNLPSWQEGLDVTLKEYLKD